VGRPLSKPSRGIYACVRIIECFTQNARRREIPQMSQSHGYPSISLECRDLMVGDFTFLRSKLHQEERQNPKSKVNLQSLTGMLYLICLHRFGG
jgi:hypothetical protein